MEYRVDGDEDVELGDLPASTKKDLAAVDGSLATSIGLWLRKHGKAVRPKLSADQKQQLKECFELMDQDGSGAIDADELGAAFKLLGIRMKKSEIEELLAEVDHDGSGEVEYLEFLEIMTTTLQRLAEEREADEAHAGEGQVPFALMATAYRRKRLMEGIISGDKEVMSQIAQLSEKQNQEAAAAAASAASAAARKAAAAAKSPETQKILTSITKRSLARLQSMHVDTELLAELSPEERRLLSSVAAKAVKQGVVGNRSPSPSPQMQAQFPVGGLIRRGGSPPLPPAMGRSPSQAQLGLGAGAHSMSPVRPRANGISNSGTGKLPLVPNSKLVHYSHTPGHQQLMEVPQVFDLRFSRSTIKLPVGASGSRSAVSLSPSQAGPVGGGGGGGLPPLGPRSGIASGTSYGSEPTTYHRASSSLQ